MFTYMARGVYRANLAAFNAAGGGGNPPDPLAAVNQVLTQYTAEQLAEFVERSWEQPRHPLSRNLAPDAINLPGGRPATEPQHRAWGRDIRGVPAVARRGFPLAPQPPAVVHWYHIVYAYLLECTNLARVFERLVAEWTHGERLPFATPATHRWLRTTEQLFFTSPLPPSIRSLSSDVRRDREAIRRNAYYRLLGLDLPHGTPDGRAYPYLKADIANREFVRAWEELLKATWAAFTNRRNAIGPDTTDDLGLAELVREIQQMLVARRNSGALSREEFDAVTWFSWFHLALYENTAVVDNLNAQSTSPALRLKKIAELVGVPIHARTDSFFQLAVPTAFVLESIEAGHLAGVPNVQRLYLGGGAIAQNMRTIVTHWSLATGRAIKGVDVGALPPQRPAPMLPSPVQSPVSFGMQLPSRIETLAR